MKASRRDFVRAAALSASALAAGASALPRRPLGKTGLEVSVIGLGGARIGTLADQADAVRVVRRCFDLGMNYFDTAAAGAYGLSQSRYGEALQGIREQVILGTKTRHRDRTQSQLDLDQSLANLRTDRIDLYQVHNVINRDDVEFIFGPKGVMEMIEKARQAGKIRFVGVTGHTDPAVLNEMLRRYPFATILIPLSVVDGANAQKSFEKETLPLARERGAGVIAMKTLGAGRVLETKAATLQECIRYVLSLPVSTAILGSDRIEQVEANVRIASAARPLSAAERERLRERMARAEFARLEPWKRLPAAPEYHAD